MSRSDQQQETLLQEKPSHWYQSHGSRTRTRVEQKEVTSKEQLMLLMESYLQQRPDGETRTRQQMCDEVYGGH